MPRRNKCSIPLAKTSATRFSRSGASDVPTSSSSARSKTSHARGTLAVRLAYARGADETQGDADEVDDSFTIPPNIILIGLMNTALPRSPGYSSVEPASEELRGWTDATVVDCGYDGEGIRNAKSSIAPTARIGHGSFAYLAATISAAARASFARFWAYRCLRILNSASLVSRALDATVVPKPFATTLCKASETSNPRSNFTQKRNCHCCVQRIGEQMRDGRREGDSLIARRVVVFRPTPG